MEETKKYYTPEIEEFHVGFEYEEQVEPGKWAWNTCHPNTFEKLYDWDSMDMLKIRTRVKYLDQEDIESLGFIKYTNNSVGENINVVKTINSIEFDLQNIR